MLISTTPMAELYITVDFLKNHAALVPVVARWIDDEWGYVNPDRTHEETCEQFSRRLNKTTIPLTMIALLGDEPVGTGSIFPDDMKTRPELTPWLAGIYVAKEMRNRGYGTTIVTAVENVARKIGFNTLYLFTPDQQRFYARLGWKILEEAEYRGAPTTLMSKYL